MVFLYILFSCVRAPSFWRGFYVVRLRFFIVRFFTIFSFMNFRWIRFILNLFRSKQKNTNMGRPKKNQPKTETVSNESTPIQVKPDPIVKNKAYFKAKLEALSSEMHEAIKADRSLSIRLKTIQNDLRRAATRL